MGKIRKARLEKMRSSKGEYLTTWDIKKLFGVSYSTILGWIKRGDLPFFKIGGKWFIRKDTLEEFIKQKESKEPKVR
jgi:excisionase family DNA binding protein